MKKSLRKLTSAKRIGLSPAKVVITLACGVAFVLTTTQSLAAYTYTSRTVKVTDSNAKAQISVTQNSKKKTVQKKRARKAKSSRYQIAAVASAIQSDSLIQKSKTSKSSIDLLPTSKSSIRKSDAGATPETKYTGAVNFTVGQDSNIDPDKQKIKDMFFEVNPTLGFEGSTFSGAFGASIRDYSDQAVSNIAKKSTANADLNMNLKLSKTATSTTTLAGLYNDEKWPDFIDDNGDGLMDGMPIRYTQIGLTQKFGFNFDSVSTEIGGSATHRDHSNLYSDYASDLGVRRFEQDYNELKAFGRLALKAGDHIELAARPSVAQKKYEQREGRQTDGQAGGETISAPKFELITSELAGDIVLSFGESNVTPTAFVGQVSDEALGAENQDFYGFGLSSKIVLDKSTSFAITPNATYKKFSYDNWTYNVDNEDLRVETEVSAGIKASINVTKNVGAAVAYDVIREKSNMSIDQSENYRQEIVGTTLTILF